jgi:hypothetical protein
MEDPVHMTKVVGVEYIARERFAGSGPWADSKSPLQLPTPVLAVIIQSMHFLALYHLNGADILLQMRRNSRFGSYRKLRLAAPASTPTLSPSTDQPHQNVSGLDIDLVPATHIPSFGVLWACR